MNILLSDSFKDKQDSLEKGNFTFGLNRRYGKTKPFLFINGEPYLSLGPHCNTSFAAFNKMIFKGKVFVFTFIFLMAVGVYISVLVATFLSGVWQFATNLVIFIEAAAYLSVALRNPGILTQNQEFVDNESELVKNPK